MDRQHEISLRNNYIQNLNEFLITANNFLEDTLHKLKWTENATIVKDAAKRLVTCPLDEGHRVPPDSIDKHVEVCRWHQLGYRDDDVPLPPPPANLPISTVVIDKTAQRDIILRAVQKDPSIKIGENVMNRDVPQTSDRFFSDFTTDERRVLYDHVVSRTAAVMPQLKEFNLTMKPEGQSAPMTREQLMAVERDAKRRRVKHRTAKVHTKSKNYSEVLREVINNQMLAYEDWIKDNFGDSNLQESVEPEKKSSEELKQDKQEMVWLDWDFRGNPHTRWKVILEREKRRIERGEKVDTRTEKDSKKDYERKRPREESSSRKFYHDDEFRKRKHDDVSKDKHYHKVSHREESKKSDDDKLRRRDKHESYRAGIGNEPNRRDKYHSRHRDRNEEKKSDKYRRDYKSKYDSDCKQELKNEDDKKYEPVEKYKEKMLGHYEDKSADSRIRSSEKYYDGLTQGSRTKEIKLEYKSYDTKNKSYDSVLTSKEKDAESSDPDLSDSSTSSSSSGARKIKKHKKSKKKHKHKHKKKHRKE